MLVDKGSLSEERETVIPNQLFLQNLLVWYIVPLSSESEPLYTDVDTTLLQAGRMIVPSCS